MRLQHLCVANGREKWSKKAVPTAQDPVQMRDAGADVLSLGPEEQRKSQAG